MKKIVCFITVLIFSISILSPLSVFADVTIGDNNEEVLSNEQLALGQKLALLELMNDLITNGVNELSIQATGSSVDDYLEYLWTEIVDAYNNPNDNVTIENFINVGTWDALASIHDRIIENAIKYGGLIGTGTASGIQSLADYFLNGNFKHKYEYHPETLRAFRHLALQNNDTPTPSPDPNYSYITKINDMYISNNVNAGVERSSDFFSTEKWCAQQGNGGTVVAQNMRSYSYISSNCTSGHYQLTESGIFSPYDYEVTTPITINVYTDSNISDEVNVIYSAYEKVSIRNIFPTYNSGVTMPINSTYPYSGNSTKQNISFRYNGVQTYVGALISVGPGGNHNYDYRQTTFSTLNDALNYIFMHYCNIDLYVDDVLWADIPDYSSNAPNLDIDGILELMGQNRPVQYYFPDDINIDYKKLYEVIKEAIDDGTPVSMDTINNNQVYNDNHDTFYAPVVYNNYNTNDGNEADFIDSVLDLATIPKFDEAYVRPINEPFTRGVGFAIIGADVIPSDIKFLFGAIFVLLLFVLMINRFFQ